MLRIYDMHSGPVCTHVLLLDVTSLAMNQSRRPRSCNKFTKYAEIS